MLRPRRPKPATVISLMALFIALGGTGYAAIKLPANSVGTKQLKKNAVTLQKIKPSAQKALRGPQGDPGPQGPQGGRGATGPQGAGPVRLDWSGTAAAGTTSTLYSRAGLSIKAQCSAGPTVTVKLGATGGTGAAANATWTHEESDQPTTTTQQGGIANGVLDVGATASGDFRRVEGQAVLRSADGSLVVSVVFHAFVNSSGGACKVDGTAAPTA